MQWLNYHHLYYFWVIARAGSISKAGQEMRISAPALSSQLRRLEDSLGQELFVRSGRKLILTDAGRTTLRYADEIFPVGRELMNAVKGQPTGKPYRLTVGIVDVLPKVVARWLIEPALHLREPVRIDCREGSIDQLVSQLAVHELDVVLSDVPVNPHLKVGAYSHLLGECGTTFVASARAAKRLKGTFPALLDGSRMLLPSENTGIRRNLDYWFASRKIQPAIAGEFQDYAMLRAFGQAGWGVFPIPSVFEKELKQQDGLQHIGHTEEVRSRFYAISVERKVKHPAVLAVCDTARRALFR